MNAIVIDFKCDEDIMVPAPWPVGIDADNKVTSGLGNDDGAVFIGFAQPGVEGLAYMPEDIGDIDFEAEELVPVFSNGGGFFNWNLIIRGVRVIEPVVITDKHFTIDIQMSNDAVQTGEDIAEILRIVLTQVEQQSEGRAIFDANGNKVGTWGYSEVAR